MLLTVRMSQASLGRIRSMLEEKHVGS